MTGFVNSIQSLGAVDGPGVRYVVFMQGCPLRCVYCHNPDTWLTEGGTPTDADELVRRALRFRPYWKNGGGVTVTGGEPLLQADFVAEFFEKLHEHGVHTALDTSGVGNLAQAEKVLEHTDLVLCDLKFLSKADYLKNCRADYGQIERFLQLTAMKGVPLWIRQKDTTANTLPPTVLSGDSARQSAIFGTVQAVCSPELRQQFRRFCRPPQRVLAAYFLRKECAQLRLAGAAAAGFQGSYPQSSNDCHHTHEGAMR